MTNKQKSFLSLLILIFGINLSIGFHSYKQNLTTSGKTKTKEKVKVMMRALRILQTQYVDPEKVKPERLINYALQGMVNSLDQFSSFLLPTNYQEMCETTAGEFGGIGIVLSFSANYPEIITVMKNSPSEKAGLQIHDQLISINNQKITKLNLKDIITKLKGAAGTKLHLSILRGNKNMKLTITRKIISIKSVRNVQIINKNIAYMHILQFGANTGKEINAALSKLLEKQPKAIIIDLRDNHGGLLTAAVEACSFFLPPNTLVVSTEGRYRTEKFYTNGKLATCPKIKIIILINENSASAAEIMAGCLKDHMRATLLGTTSYGKGSVQIIVNLEDGPHPSALRLTTAMYYTPKREVIHGHGIVPDVIVPLTNEQKKQRLQMLNNSAYSSKYNYKKDKQITEALKTINNTSH